MRRPRHVIAVDLFLVPQFGTNTVSGQLAKAYGFTDLDGSQPDACKYFVEMQDAGKPADVTAIADTSTDESRHAAGGLCNQGCAAIGSTSECFQDSVEEIR
jgi:hypothetical protein